MSETQVSSASPDGPIADVDGGAQDSRTPDVGAMDLSFVDGATRDCDDEDFLVWAGDSGWRVNNSGMFDYSRRANINGEPSGLADVIEERIGYSRENVALDVAAGSDARALRDLMRLGIVGRALATNYKDKRPRSTKRVKGLDHIKGDLIERRPWEEMLAWAARYAPEGFDLVMHRPVGGLQRMNKEFYHGAGHLLLDMVKAGGLLFVQVPRPIADRPAALVDLCQEVRGREDVEGVITTRRKPERGRNRDESDLYAVVFKGLPLASEGQLSAVDQYADDDG